MAKVEVKMPEQFLLKLSRLGERTDEIIPKVLEAGGEVVLSKVKSNLQAVFGNGAQKPPRATGGLGNSFGTSPRKQDKGGNYNIKIGFTEPRKDGESNAKIANIIEYGKSGQPPRPFLKPAKSATRKSCIEAMKSRLEQELGRI